MAFLAFFVCVDCLCLVKGFFALAAICSVLGAELRWRHNSKAAQQMLSDADCTQARGKNKRHELIAFAACSKDECLKVVWINLEVSPVHRFSYRLVFTSAFFFYSSCLFLVHRVLQSYVL